MSENELSHGDLNTVWRCESCDRRVGTIPEGECECGAESWDERSECPECEGLMEYGGASNRLGTQGVSWVRCLDCEVTVL